MAKLIGAALVMLGCVGLGVRAYMSLGAAVRALADYSSMLELLRCEIELRLSPLERALDAARSVAGTRRFVDRVKDGLNERGGAAIAEVWSDAAALAPQSIRAILAELAPVLGRYDAAEQGRAIADAAHRIDELRTVAETEQRRSGRMYITFGVCGGIAATVLFL